MNKMIFLAAILFTTAPGAQAQIPGAEGALGVRARVVEQESHHVGGPSLFALEAQVFRLMQSVEPLRPTFAVTMVGTGRGGEEFWRDTKTLEWRPCRATQTGEICAVIAPLLMPGLERYLCNITVQAASGPVFSLDWGRCQVRPRGNHLPDLAVGDVVTTATGGATVTVRNSGGGPSTNYRIMAVALDGRGGVLNSRLVAASEGLGAGGTTSIELGTMAAPLFACELFVAVDPDGIVGEGRLQNNWIRVPFGLCEEGGPVPAPDLVVTDITWPATLAPGALMVPVTISVTNSGGRPAVGLGGALEGELKLQTGAGVDLVILHTQRAGALGPGETAQFTVTVPTILFEQACLVTAAMAPRGADGERMIANNFLQKSKSCTLTKEK